ncbi:hypothetical protein ARMGADRAFT_1131681, partial [Armillaria gallica]
MSLSDLKCIDILEGSDTDSEESSSDQNREGSSNGGQAHKTVQNGGSLRKEEENQAQLMALPTMMSAESCPMILPTCAPIPTTPAQLWWLDPMLAHKYTIPEALQIQIITLTPSRASSS